MKARLPKQNQGGAQNMNAMIRQAQKMQDEIEAREFSATAGGGAVQVVVTGKKSIKSLTIQPEVVDPEDIEMLQDLVISAINEAINNVEETTETEMSKITGGVSLPGLFRISRVASPMPAPMATADRRNVHPRFCTSRSSSSR